MTERLVQHWTPTLEEAYGPAGKIGRDGELLLLEALNKAGFQTIDHESDFNLQKAGIDISIKKPEWARYYTVDVKTGNSFINKYGTLKIDLSRDGWLYNKSKTSDRVWHVNLVTGWSAFYDRKQMIAHIKTLPLDEGEETLELTMKQQPSDLVRRMKLT